MSVGISTEEYKELLIRKEEKEMSDDISELAAALSKAQLELETVKKDSKSYGYNYSDLASVLAVAKPALHSHGLSVSQLLLDAPEGYVKIKTLLMHSSGQFLSSSFSMEIPEMKGANKSQERGSSVTYGRRYALQAILNMASEDNDASSKPKLDSSKFKKSEEKVAKEESSDEPKKKPRFRKKKVEEEF